MKIKLKIIVTAMSICLGIMLVTGCTKEEAIRDEPESIIETKMPEETVGEEAIVEDPQDNKGALKASESFFLNNHYSNPYFGFEFDVPESWSVLNQEETDALFGLGLELMADQVDEIDSDASMDDYDIVGVFAAYKYPVDQQMAINPSVLINAEKNKALDIFLDGKDYLAATKEMLLATDYPFEFDDEMTQFEYAGNTYSRLLGQLDVGTALVIQEYYVTKINGYWVNITCSYSEDDGHEMVNIFFGDL